MRRKIAILVVLALWQGLVPVRAFDFGTEVLISAHDQRLAVINNGKVVAKYAISTSKFGLGDSDGSYKTPLGTLWVCNKIGGNLPAGAVIKNRTSTGEVVVPNAAGRDAIVSRVIWLHGLDDGNRNAYNRCIYIHGTPEERRLGNAVSFGCVRMSSKDVIALYNKVEIGTHVVISDMPLKKMLPQKEKQPSQVAAWLLQNGKIEQPDNSQE